jgi:hypothetical protein
MRFEEKVGIVRNAIKEVNQYGVDVTFLKVKFPDENVCEVNVLKSMQKIDWEQTIKQNKGTLQVRCVKIIKDYGYPEFLLIEII